MDGFDKSKFFGRWIEVEKTPSMFDLFLRCMSADYSDDNDGSLNVVIRGVSLAGLPISLAGDALPVDSSKKGFYSVRYGFGVPFQGTFVTVVDTDYEKYAILYSCTNSVMSNLYHTEYVWLLARNDSLPNYIRQNAYDTLDARKVTRTGLNLSDRNNCPPPNSVATAGREELIMPAIQPLIPYAAAETTTASSIVSYVASGADLVQPIVPIVPIAPIAPIVPLVEPIESVPVESVAANLAEQIIV
jgi:apolipoprotein D and lipocalin family protein